MISARIRNARQSQGMSQSDLATASGLHVSAISHFERGERMPSVLNLIRLAKALGVSIDWLCELKGGE